MKLALFGASGRVGQALAGVALARGWGLRALVRTASPYAAPPGVEVIRGSLDSMADVAATLVGTAAACCVFGPRPPYAEAFCARGTAQVVAAMKAAGVRRLVCLTGAMVGELPPNVSLPMRVLAGLFRRRRPHIAADGAEQERVVMTSGLGWTIVKPPRLTDGAGTGRVRAEPALRVGLMSRISRSDLAAFLLDELVSSHHLGQRVYVSA